jgi:HD-GYP domain-containing protein (c-di-GMP phosphodiesterase class II)
LAQGNTVSNLDDIARELNLLLIEEEGGRCVGMLRDAGFRHVAVLDPPEVGPGSKPPCDAALVDWTLFIEGGATQVSELFGDGEHCVFAILPADGDEEARAAAIEAGFAGWVDLGESTDICIVRLELMLREVCLGREVKESTRENQRMFLNMLQLMAKILEAKDPYTRYHSENVAAYAYRVARRLDFETHHLELMVMAGILHDFGKIGVREEILNKPSALDAEERELVERHPLVASTILEPIDELKDIIGDIRHHHEHFDGTGYPNGLKGEEIPLGARILHLAEAYDSMVTERAYRPARSRTEVREELRRLSGIQFDPQLVDIFMQVLEEDGDLSDSGDGGARAREVQRSIINSIFGSDSDSHKIRRKTSRKRRVRNGEKKKD